MENSSGGMSGFFKGTWQLVSSSSHSRTFSLLVLLIIMAAVPLTVFVSQQQQETRQRATGTDITIQDLRATATANGAIFHAKIIDNSTDTGDRTVTLFVSHTSATDYKEEQTWTYPFSAIPTNKEIDGESGERSLPQGTHTWYVEVKIGATSKARVDGIPIETPQRYEIHGTVWVDTNGNGTKDSTDAGKGSVVVNLSGTATQTKETLTNGEYYFQNLTPGTYTVAMTLPQGFELTTNAAPNPRTGVVLSNSNVDVSWGIKPVVATSFTIKGFVYYDKNNNNQFDPSSDMAVGTGVQIKKEGSPAAPLSAPTGLNGEYSISGLSEGTYTLTVSIDPSKYDIISPNPVTKDINSNTTTNRIAQIDFKVVPKGTSTDDFTFGGPSPASNAIVSNPVIFYTGINDKNQSTTYRMIKLELKKQEPSNTIIPTSEATRTYNRSNLFYNVYPYSYTHNGTLADGTYSWRLKLTLGTGSPIYSLWTQFKIEPSQSITGNVTFSGFLPEIDSTKTNPVNFKVKIADSLSITGQRKVTVSRINGLSGKIPLQTYTYDKTVAGNAANNEYTFSKSDIPSGLNYWDVTVELVNRGNNYGSQMLSFRIGSTSITRSKGDINGDGAINLIDYNAWRDRFGGSGDAGCPSVHTDGKVCPDIVEPAGIDILDFNAWYRAYSSMSNR